MTKPQRSLHQVKNSRRGAYCKAYAHTIGDGTGLGMVITMTAINVNYVAKRCGTNMTWEVIEVNKRIVYLVDNGLGKSITNDAERVLDWVSYFYPGRRTVYKDTDGLWWSISYVRTDDQTDLHVEFKPWHGEVWDILSTK